MSFRDRQRGAVAPVICLVVAAALSKGELQGVAPLYGAANLEPYEGHEAAALRLVTFAGRWDKAAGKFVGEYRFSNGGPWLNDQTNECFDFGRLPGVLKGEGKRVKGEAKKKPPGGEVHGEEVQGEAVEGLALDGKGT